MMFRMLALAAALALTVACDDGDAKTVEPGPEPEPEMISQPLCEETDFGGTGWSGSATVDGALALDAEATYRVSTTVLFLKDGDTPFEKFNQVLGPILGALGENDGLLAYQFGGSTRCGAQRTITIWRDAEAMYRFVGSPAHVDAMALTAEIGRDARVESWESAGSEVGDDWAGYKARLTE